MSKVELVSDDEPAIDRPAKSRLHYPADRIRPGVAPEAMQLWWCGCCVSHIDAIETALEREPVGTEIVCDGERWRKVAE